MRKPSFISAILMGAAVFAALGGAFAGENTNLPFGPDTFESSAFGYYTNGTPLINGTNGWYGSSADIIVVSNLTIGASGTNSAMIPVDNTLSNRFNSATITGTTNVWLQMDVRPSLYAVTNRPKVNTNMAVMFYINTNGNFVVHDGPASPDAANSTNWVVTTGGAIATNGTNWVTIGIYEDFNMQRWHLYADGTLVTNNIKFINQSLTNFSGFSVYNGGTTTYLDNVSAMASNKTVLTITGSFTVSNKIYDASAAAAISNNLLTLVGTNSGDDVTLMPVAVFSNKNAGVDINVSLTGSWLAGTHAINYSLSLAGAPTATGDIAQAAMTASLTSTITKIYDGNDTATNIAPANYALVGFIGSETCTVNQTDGTYANSNAGSSIVVSATLASTDFNGSGGFNTNNYALPTSAAGNVGVITKKPLTAILVPTISKTYNRNFVATLGVTNYALAGFIGSETCTVNQTGGTYASSNAGSAIAVTATLAPTDFSGSGGFNTNNYALPTSAAGNVGVITQQTLTLGGSFQVSNKQYDATTTATITNNSLITNNVIAPDVVMLNAVAVFEDADVGNGKTVYLTNSTLTGADAPNYTLNATNPTTTADITKGDQTITFPPIPAQPLSQVTLTLSATASSGLTVTFTNLSGPGTVNVDIITFYAAGENTVQASQDGNSNWNPAPDVTRTFPVYDDQAGPTTNTIPWSDDFENYWNLHPLVNGTNGWFGSSTNIIVQTNIVRTGTKAAMIPGDGILSNRFVSSASTNVWRKMDLRPSLRTNNPVVDTNMATMFFVNTNGNFVVHNGPALPDAAGSTNWVVATNISIGTNGTNWVTVGIYEDYAQTNWHLYADGVLVTNNIGFINTNLTNFTGFNVYNAAPQTSYLDNVSVTAPGAFVVTPTNLAFSVVRGYDVVFTNEFAINVETGVWNFANTISTNSTNWLSVSTIAGTVDAAVTNSTNIDAIATVTNGTPVGIYTGTVTVSATNSAGCPRTETVAVTLTVLEPLQVAPTNLAMTNGVMEGSNIPSQTFSVWNVDVGINHYTAEPQGDMTNWMSLSAYSGDAGSNVITVYYNTNLPPGDYTGMITVASSESGGTTSHVYLAAQVVAKPVLGLDPLSLCQSMAKGGHPVTNHFDIWNASIVPRVPMAYTLTVSNGSPALIQNILDSGGGQSSGGTNSVTINYNDVSSNAAGIYTAMVQVVAHDAGTTYVPTGTVWLSGTVTVLVEIVGLAAPAGITASDGAYTNRVAVSWHSVMDAMNYKVYRSTAFDSSLADLIGEPVATNLNDLTATAGLKYYYWVSAVNSNWSEGAMSTNRESGYCALPAPGGIFATDGAYTNKVRITWPLVDGANNAYLLYRGFEGGTLAPLYFTVGGVYEDMAVVPGVHYEYKVMVTNGMFGSALSVGDTGYAFGAPGGLAASKGVYVRKVRVTWNAVESASEYEVWRSARAVLPPQGGAAKIATTTTATFDDSNVAAGTTYYYWARAISLEAGTGGWSAMDHGYGAAAGLDLWITNLVVLPAQVGVGGSPVIVSFRMGNAGETNMAGANGTVGMEFFASTNPVFGASGKISMGKVVDMVTLAVGTDMVMNVSGSQLTAPATEGDYYIFAQVLPEYPSLLVDTNPNDNVARRNGIMRVRSSGGLNYHAFNDYDGDGISDLGVYRGVEWSIKSVDERVLITGVNVFGGAGQPVLGDLDGDRRSDPMVYDSLSRLWQVRYSGSGYTWASGALDISGYRGLVADYERVGHGEVSVFHEANGRWNVLKANGHWNEWNWGAPGYEPVIGDYDGDGRWDLAVYQETTGLWFIRTLNDEVPMVSGVKWGGPGYHPVAGDYDGDGYWDAAIYLQAVGQWFIGSLDGRILEWGLEWGGAGFEPVMGDYDGDGKWDLAVYHEATGLWYIRTLQGRTLAWASHWGGPGYRPLGN